MNYLLVLSMVFFAGTAWSQTIDQWKAVFLDHGDQHWAGENTSGRQKPDSVGSYDMERVEITFSVDDFGLPTSLSYQVTVRPTVDGLNALPLAAAFYRPLAVSRLDGPELEFTHNPDAFELIIRPDIDLIRGESMTFVIDGEMTIPCDDPTSCIDGAPYTHLVAPAWYPLSLEFPTTDRFQIQMTVDVRDGLTLSAAGGQTSQTPIANGTRYIFETEQNAYISAFAIGDYRFSEAENGVELYGPRRANRDVIARYAMDAKAYFETLMGPFPFSRLAVTAIDDAASAGIGPQANIFIPQALWLLPEQHPMASLVPEVISHEIGHQYFFNLIAITDQPEAWMSEGFAEYVATRASEERTGTQTHLMRNHWTYIYDVDGAGDVPLWGVTVRESEYYFPIVYQKGSAVLGMLRRRVGDDVFDGLLRAYVSAFSGQTTTTTEFKDFAADYLEADWVNKFFDDWVYRAGYPILVASVQRGRTDADPVVLSLTQSPTQGELFEGPIPIRLKGNDADVDDTIQLNGSPYEFDPIATQWLEIDPENTIFRRIRPEPSGDVNLNGVVDGMDLLDVNALQRRDPTDADWDDRLDTNDDQRIDQRDISAVIDQFGEGW